LIEDISDDHKMYIRIGMNFVISTFKKDKYKVDSLIHYIIKMDENHFKLFLYGIYIILISYREILSDKFMIDFEQFSNKLTKSLNEIDLLDSVKFEFERK